jgi:hypothetical protein
MSSTNLKRAFATLAVGMMLAVAGAAGLIAYNGHAGLGSASIHDGTSNTLMVGLRA